MFNQKQYRQDHTEEFKAYDEQYRKDHVEEHKAYVKEWYKDHAEECKERTKQWRREQPEAGPWRSMIKRCTYPKHDSFRIYGGAGVTVCERWLNSREDFLADVGPRPSLKHTLGRILDQGNYEPGNAVWMTVAHQMANRRIKNWLNSKPEIPILVAPGEQ
jgi:hypothetical protein